MKSPRQLAAELESQQTPPGWSRYRRAYVPVVMRNGEAAIVRTCRDWSGADRQCIATATTPGVWQPAPAATAPERRMIERAGLARLPRRKER